MTSLIVALVSIAVNLLLFVVGCWKSYSVGFSHGDTLSDKEHLEAMLVLEREQKQAVMQARGRIREARKKIKEEKGDEALAGVVAMAGGSEAPQPAGPGPGPSADRGVSMPGDGVTAPRTSERPPS